MSSQHNYIIVLVNIVNIVLNNMSSQYNYVINLVNIVDIALYSL